MNKQFKKPIFCFIIYSQYFVMVEDLYISLLHINKSAANWYNPCRNYISFRA